MGEEKKNLTLIIIAAILTLIVIACIVSAICMSSVSSNKEEKKNTGGSIKNEQDISQKPETDDTKNKPENQDKKDDIDNSENNTVKKEDIDDEPEEVNKINESEGTIYENVIDSGNGRTIKVPVINLTTKYVTEVNNEVEKIYKDFTSKSYSIYSYYMYIGTVTLIIDNVKSNGHFYNIYNINTKTGKKLTNDEILQKANMSKEEFKTKINNACKSKFEEIYKEDKSSSSYKEALEKSIKDSEDTLMYITNEGKVECVVKLYSPVDISSNEYIISL